MRVGLADQANDAVDSRARLNSKHGTVRLAGPFMPSEPYQSARCGEARCQSSNGRASRNWGYLGLVPALKQSGRKSRIGKITRKGNSLTRSRLWISAGVVISRALLDSAIGDWAKELQRRIGFGKSRIALARKIAVVMLSIWKADSKFICYPRGTQSTLASGGLDSDKKLMA